MWALIVTLIVGLIVGYLMGGRLCRPLRPLHGRFLYVVNFRWLIIIHFIYQHTIFHHNYI